MTDKNRILPRNETVSVVIPCYNASSFIGETLSSVINQKLPPVEILVIDDGSTDDSAEIARNFGPPVRVIRQDNAGESVARNRGLDEATSHWTALLDADDLWEPNKLQQQVRMANDCDAVVCHTNYRNFGADDMISRIEDVPECKRYSVPEICTSNPIGAISTVMIQTNLSPRFPEWTQYGEDRIFYLELLKIGKIVLLTEPLTKIRKFNASQSSRPDIEIRWYESCETWLREHSGLPLSEIEEIRSGRLRRVVDAAWIAKEKRNWIEYNLLREFLHQFSGQSFVDALLENRIYPPWAYKLKDLISKTRMSSAPRTPKEAKEATV